MNDAYFNEFDPYAAQWLRNLIAAGYVAAGVVDERSIEDVHPDDLRGFRQCHFFAGIGIWSHALRLAGWPDDRPVWTGSCPCQPFSSAGKGAGFADERHLWPAWHHLIRERRPAVVLGEQVASKDAGAWIDLVQDDLEAMGYAFGAVPFPAAGVGAPHIRDRLYWVAHASRPGLEGRDLGAVGHQRQTAERSGATGGLAHPDGRHARTERQQRGGQQRQQPQDGRTFGMGDPHCIGEGEKRRILGRPDAEPGRVPAVGSAGPLHGFWRDADWIFCRDGRWRPVEPGTFPLAHGAPARVGRLRAYGNGLCAPQAAEFIKCVMEARP